MKDLDPEFLARLQDACGLLYIDDKKHVQLKQKTDDPMLLKMADLLQMLIDTPEIRYAQDDGVIRLRWVEK